jgi:hypothetical protein
MSKSSPEEIEQRLFGYLLGFLRKGIVPDPVPVPKADHESLQRLQNTDDPSILGVRIVRTPDPVRICPGDKSNPGPVPANRVRDPECSQTQLQAGFYAEGGGI